MKPRGAERTLTVARERGSMMSKLEGHPSQLAWLSAIFEPGCQAGSRVNSYSPLRVSWTGVRFPTSSTNRFHAPEDPAVGDDREARCLRPWIVMTPTPAINANALNAAAA